MGKGLEAKLLVKQIAQRPADYVTIDVENAVTVNGLTKVPLIGVAQWGDLEYLSFAEASEKGLQILETGHVPELVVHNQTEYKVFIPAGQLFVSQEHGWQDRMSLGDILIDAGYKGTIPVACVEHGRWHQRSGAEVDRYVRRLGAVRSSGHFASTHYLVSPEPAMRALDAVEEFGTLEAGASMGAQQDIWEKVSVETHAADAKSPTGAFTEVYAKKTETSKFQIFEGEIGGIFLGNGTVLGMEFYNSGQAWQKFAAPVIKRYDLAVKDRSAKANNKVIGEFMVKLAKAEPKELKHQYLGTLVSLAGAKGITGSALVYEGTPLHFIALPSSGEKKGHGAVDFSGLGIRGRGAPRNQDIGREDADAIMRGFIGPCVGMGPERRYGGTDGLGFE